MRHINGVYTQRYNRLSKTDGSLFRGRYKAIVIEEDSYQLQVSRYIHLNPLEAHLVDHLTDYPWSSYKYFIRRVKTPDWLYPQEILRQVGKPPRVKEQYRTFVELGVDEELKQFYGKGNIMPYLGSDSFRNWVYSQKETDEEAVSEKDKYPFRPDMDKIIADVASMMGVSVSSIMTAKRGKANVPRWIAMYLCQEIGGHHLNYIAKKFALKRAGSIPNTITKLKVLMKSDEQLKNKIS